MDSRRSAYMDKQTHGSMSKDSRRSTCTDALRSTCTEVSIDSTGLSTVNASVQGCTRIYISTKGMGVHRGTSMEFSTVNMVVRERMNVYDKYRGYKSKGDIFMYSVGREKNEISYYDALQ